MSKRIPIDLTVLDKLYQSRKFTNTQLSYIFDCSTRTINRRLKELGYDLLKDTSRDEFGRLHCKGRKLPPLTKENNGNYRGGISIYRTLAFFEYGNPYKCFHCPSTDDLVVHHLDRDRYNNHPSNLRVVCRSCHMKVEHPDIIEHAQRVRLEKLKEKKKQKLREKIKTIK